MYDYRALPLPGGVIGEDIGRGVGWTYDPFVFVFFSHQPCTSTIPG